MPYAPYRECFINVAALGRMHNSGVRCRTMCRSWFTFSVATTSKVYGNCFSCVELRVHATTFYKHRAGKSANLIQVSAFNVFYGIRLHHTRTNFFLNAVCVRCKREECLEITIFTNIQNALLHWNSTFIRIFIIAFFFLLQNLSAFLSNSYTKRKRKKKYTNCSQS